MQQLCFPWSGILLRIHPKITHFLSKIHSSYSVLIQCSKCTVTHDRSMGAKFFRVGGSASHINPPPPVKAGTGVFFNWHGSPKPPVLERRKTLWWARLCRQPFTKNHQKMGVSFYTPIRAFVGSQKSQKNDPGLILKGLGGVLKMELRPGLQKV